MAALFIAAPRRFDVARLHRVHPDNAGAQTLDHAQAAEDVARPDRGRQTVWCVVGNFESVVFVLERNAGHNRPEDFLACDSSVVVGFEHCGLHEVTVPEFLRRRSPAAGDEFRFFASDLDIVLDRLALCLRDQRPDVGLQIERVADVQAARAPDQALQEIVMQRLGDEAARARLAALAAVEEYAEQHAVGRQIEVGVGHDQAG